ncbi:MAG: 4-hydroxyacetophenone monooxygenase, partial [Subtercola sp.]|nr:4-hydroxyacetophenone monooxygenase [Subtercola sp.]
MTSPTGDNGAALLTREELEHDVAEAAVPALLMVVFQVTGDRKWLGEHYRPTRGKGINNHE